MPNTSALTFAKADAAAVPLHVLTPETLGDLPVEAEAWARTMDFAARPGQALVVPAPDGTVLMALVGAGDDAARARGRFGTAAALNALPDATFRLVTPMARPDAEEFALGWLLQAYSFGRYTAATPPKARLIAPDGIDAPRIEAIAAGEALTRDLINTPANDMGPAELEQAARDLAAEHSAEIAVIAGEDLLTQNYPLIHTVGRAATEDRGPRLIEMTWGQAGPRLTLVGKGVCFDTGGLNLKPGASMGLMKKDMGGAATVMGLAHMIMALRLPLRLRLLIPAVENAVSGPAFRPGDILPSRKGLTVEVNNTDAEGRLVLADALALAAEDEADLTISMATLTGAARVAVGPDLAPYFTDDETVASALMQAGGRVADPVWRLPFHTPYEPKIEPGIADLDNAPAGGMAGAITAALFLRRFAPQRYVHFDIYGWQPVAAPARPKGGVGQGARAVLEALPEALGL